MDQPAFERMILPCYRQMLATAMRLLGGDNAGASDAVQDTIAHLWEMRNRLDIAKSAPALCVTAVRNRCLSLLRARRDYQDIAETAIETSERTDQQIRAQQVMEAVDALSEPRRGVMLMSMQGYDAPEIAKKLHLTEVNVRQLLSRARKQLRQQLKET